MRLVFWVRTIFFASVAVVLTACGGGGGGGGGGGSASALLSVDSDRNALEFVNVVGAAGPSQVVGFTLLNGSGTYYGAIVADDSSAFRATFTATSDKTAVVSITPQPTDIAGKRTGSITFKLCTDATCNNVAWSKSLPYTLTVFGVDTASITASGFEGDGNRPTHLTITPADTSRLLTVSSSTSAGTRWLSAVRSSDSTIDVALNGSSLLAGTYGGAITLTLSTSPGNPGISLNVPVVYSQGPGFIAPAVPAIDVTLDSTMTSLTRSATVSFNGHAAASWQALSDQPWLRIQQSTGNGAGNVTFAVDPSQLQSVPNWTATSANITLKATGFTDAQFVVNVNKRLPEVHWASGKTAIAGRATTLKVNGKGFSQLPSVGRILIDGAPVTGQLVSDTEALIDVPSSAAGTKTVSIVNSAGATTRTAKFGVAPLGVLTAASVANSGDKIAAIFDPTRNAVFAANNGRDSLVRYQLVNGAWRVDSLPVSRIGNLALGTDLQTLYVVSSTDGLLEVDPDTMAVKVVHRLTASLDGLRQPVRESRGLAITQDLKIWFDGFSEGLRYFDIVGNSFGLTQQTGGPYFMSPDVFASADGSHLIVHQGILPTPHVQTYLPGTGSFTAAPAWPDITLSAMWSADGARILIDKTSLNDGRTGAPLGSLQGASGAVLATVLSPDGRRIYALTTLNMATLGDAQIEVYDATQTQTGTLALNQIGQFPAGGQAVACDPTRSDACYSPRGVFFISPLGDTLFWVGNQNLVVIPIAANMIGTSGVKRLQPAFVH